MHPTAQANRRGPGKRVAEQSMLEITRPARRMIDEAWREGRVLAMHLGWAGRPSVDDTELTWLDATDTGALARLVPVSDRLGAPPIYVARDLVPLLRLGLTLTHRRLFGIWPRITVVPSLP
jgi:hypothetical protein